MKKTFLLLVACVTTLVGLRAQESAKYNDLNYLLDNKKLTAEVDKNPQAYGEIVIPDEITVGQKRYRVTVIGDKAFKGCKKLSHVVFPRYLERVYRSAFDGTAFLTDKQNWSADGFFSVNDTILLFTNKNVKAKCVVDPKYRLIAAGAFEGNKTVTSVVLPEGLKVVEENLFKGCKNLGKVIIPKSVKKVMRYAFDGTAIYLNDKIGRAHV